MKRHYFNAILLLSAVVLMSSCSSSLPESVVAEYDNIPEVIDFNYHVRPIMADRCFQCHGPDEGSRKGGLRLDIEEEAFKKLATGNFAFSKGNLSNSEAIHRMISADPAEMMPPPESNLSLTSREIAIISKWVEQGAEWKKHWAFNTVSRPSIPEGIEEANTRNEIDHFIQGKMKETNLTPNSKALPEVLFRRVTMDLTGLPPNIEDLDRFLDNPSEEALDIWIDQLFETDQFAERMAMEWLDVARYADSHGMAFDGRRTSWPYRDWLIEAFKRNIPYDEFITHQVAGDLIPDADLQSQKATAFYRLNPMEGSAGSILEEFRVEYVNERAGLTGTAFLGLTLECAKCHDHKFDPIKQKEFYQMAAFFNSTPEYGLAPLEEDRPPTLTLLTDEQKSVMDSLVRELNASEKELETVTQNFVKNKKVFDNMPSKVSKKDLEIALKFDTAATFKEVINPKAKKKNQITATFKSVDLIKKIKAKVDVEFVPGKKGNAALFDADYAEIFISDTANFEHNDPFSVHAWVMTSKESPGATQSIVGNSGHVFQFYRGWEFALDSTNRLQVKLINRKPDDFIEIRSIEPIPANEWNSVAFTYNGLQSAKGIEIFRNGKLIDVEVIQDNLTRSIKNYLPAPEVKPELQIGQSRRVWTEDKGHFKGKIDELEIYKRMLSHWEIQLLAGVQEDKPSEAIKLNYSLLQNKEYQKAIGKVRELRGKVAQLKDTSTQIMVMADLPHKRKTFVLKGGIYNQYADTVQEGGIEAVLPFDEKYPKNRLGLAQWLTAPENPLVARVAVNRYWKMLFGRGLVDTAEDFGIQGSLPTHPELLDWLASEFVESNWDVRHILKLMVSSATYQQSSLASSEQLQNDPENQYYSYFPSYRYPAEILRDHALATSGLLHKKVGGKPAKPYQPKGLWKEAEGAYYLREYKEDSLEGLYRRSMYTFVRRYTPNPIMSNFDVPNREVCTIRRNITHTPLQALTLLNSTQFVEATRVLAEKSQIEADTAIHQQLDYIYRSLTSLKISPEKLKILGDQYYKTKDYFMQNPAYADSLIQVGAQPYKHELDKISTATLAIIASTVLNSDESYMKR